MAASLNQPRSFFGMNAAQVGLSAEPRFERILAGVVLFLAATPFFDLLGTGPYASIVTQLSWAILYLLALILLTIHLKDRWIVWAVQRLPAVMFVLTIVVFSNFWTLDQSLTLRRSISLVGTCLIGVYLGLRFSPADLLRILFWTLSLLVALSILVVLAAPAYGTLGFSGTDRFPNAWKGVLHHKQSLGAVAAYGAVICVAMLTAPAARRLPWIAALVVFILVLVMARSVTALGGVLVAGGTILSLLLMRQFRFPFLGAFLIVAYGALLLPLVVIVLAEIMQLSVLTEFVGRDATLTGRVSTWQDAFGMIADRPLTGFGYEAVWQVPGGTHLPEFLKSGISSHAHNGYLNLATQVGLPAALATIGFLLVTFFRAMREYFFEPSTFLTFSVGYLAMFAITNMADSTLFDYQEFECVLFIAMSVMVTRIALGETGSRSSWPRTMVSSAAR